MNAVQACPNDRQLQQITSGSVSAEEMEAFACHLEACSTCAGRVAAPSEPTDLGRVPYQIDERMRAMMAKLERMGEAYLAGLSHASTEYPTRSSDTPAPDAPLALEEEFTSFLSAAQAPDEIGRLGPYRILKILGAGGMGVVFQAEDTKLKRPVALKAMRPALAGSPSSRQRFLREAQAAAAVRHDHVVTIYQGT